MQNPKFKKVSIALLAVSVLSLAGCKESADNFVGTWEGKGTFENKNLVKEFDVTLYIDLNESGKVVTVNEVEHLAFTAKPDANPIWFKDGEEVNERESSYYFTSDTLTSDKDGVNVRFVYDEDKDTLTEKNSIFTARGEMTYTRVSD